MPIWVPCWRQSHSRSSASELYRPEAPNAPIQASAVRMTYCDAARIPPRRASARPYAQPKWQAGTSRFHRSGRSFPSSSSAFNGTMLIRGRPGPPAGYKNMFAGRCFRCLGSDHKVANCRDPLRCLACWRFGHLARNCPEKKEAAKRPSIQSRLRFPKPSIHSRISFTEQQPPSIHSRLVFPPINEAGAAEGVRPR